MDETEAREHAANLQVVCFFEYQVARNAMGRAFQSNHDYYSVLYLRQIAKDAQALAAIRFEQQAIARGLTPHPQ